MLYFSEKLIIIRYWNWFQMDAKLLGGGKLGLGGPAGMGLVFCLLIYLLLFSLTALDSLKVYSQAVSF